MDTLGWPEEKGIADLPQPIWVDHAFLRAQDSLPALHSHEEKLREANYSLISNFKGDPARIGFGYLQRKFLLTSYLTSVSSMRIWQLFQLRFFITQGHHDIPQFSQLAMKKTGLLNVLTILGGSSKDC